MFKKINKYRSRARSQKLLRLASVPKTGSVLDVACGDGTLLALLHVLSPQLSLYGTDVDQSLIANVSHAYSYINFIKSNSQSLPFPDKQFDVIFCSMAFHHFEDMDKTIHELSRVLKDTGCLYVVDIILPNRIVQKVYNMFGCYEPYHFEKFYTMEELKQVSGKHGLVLTSHSRLAFFPNILSLCFSKKM